MVAQVRSATLSGIEAVPVTVEVDRHHTPEIKFSLVGLPDKAVMESYERVRAAFRNSHMDWPTGHTVVNLAPADIRKEGPLLDLAIAIAVLSVTHQVTQSELEGTLFIGELGLDGTLRPVDGA
ncbi:MAG: magnesium chelatase domain-containing protein, partial [Armatimonadota bacterium]